LFNQTELLLAGKGSEELVDNLQKEMSLKNIKTTGTVDDIKPFIASAKASIIPLWQGSGSRLKCIEAMALKTQIISTSLGAEGIKHEGTILLADNAIDFQNSILQVLNNQTDYTIKAFEICKKQYSLDAILISLDKIIKNLLEDS
ncbi:MAG: glycosyltransferase family 4 protein, partial [Bacteroidales bacterium]|nr:glycosyltransferase family 4 protein [Bacteroidales bacterium]